MGPICFQGLYIVNVGNFRDSQVEKRYFYSLCKSNIDKTIYFC